MLISRVVRGLAYYPREKLLDFRILPIKSGEVATPYPSAWCMHYYHLNI